LRGKEVDSLAKALVIVESPAKAKTIKKFLGRNYKVEASMGHVRDLPKSQLGVDVEEGFSPKYITIRGKGPVLRKLRDAAKKVDKVYLATDPDREGEAISWHLSHALNLNDEAPHRVVFHEITKDAVKSAIGQPRHIDETLVNAQQARRILDRLVGYKLSPLLWRKIRKGLSAGRVQSVAVRMICDREEEREAFEPEEYWSLEAAFSKHDDAEGRARDVNGALFSAGFYGTDDEKVELNSEEQVKAIMADLEGADFTVDSVKKRQRRRRPPTPFTTSTLQQTAASRLGYSVRKTMQVAQQLYEGLQLKSGESVGLITYIRTDSTRTAESAQSQARAYIEDTFGSQYRPAQPRKAKSGKASQDAHEAVRPTSVLRSPQELKDSLKRDQYRLYKLIWERFVASQMSSAVYDQVTVRIKGGRHLFSVTGSTLKFPGFLKVYTAGTGNESEDVLLPDLSEGEMLLLRDLRPKQHFTQPPPRYNEASLVKALEELGIGRPSTYAPTIETIRRRRYVQMEDRRLKPTELGTLVVDLLKEHFHDIINLEFTANMEEQLDNIEEGSADWVELLSGFYGPFEEVLEKADQAIEKVELPVEETDVVCEKCGRNMVIKYGRYGKFLACPGFPDCRNTKPYVEKTGAKCPECNGDIVERRTKKGRKFYGCANYPECEFTTWNKPLDESCPNCGSFLVQRRSKGAGDYYQCVKDGCQYTRPAKES